MVENHQFISESIMEGPGLPGQLRKREEKLAKAQKKAEEQLGSPSRWATLFER